MMHLKPNSNSGADLLKFEGFISEKQSGIIRLTKLVVALSILSAILMVALR